MEAWHAAARVLAGQEKARRCEACHEYAQEAPLCDNGRPCAMTRVTMHGDLADSRRENGLTLITICTEKSDLEATSAA